MSAIGGVDVPRVLICGPEFITNRSFEVDLTGVSSPSVAAEQVADTTTPFGDYAMKITDDNAAAQEYAEVAIETGANIAGKRFVVVAWVRNDVAGIQDFWTDFGGLSGDFKQDATCDDNWRQRIKHEVNVPGGASGTALAFRIYPFQQSLGNAGLGVIRIDNIRCREVLEDFELPEIERDKLIKGFAPEVQAKNRLVNGSLKTYNRRMRFIYESEYDVLDNASELLRRKLITTQDEILFFPHKDYEMCFFMEWGDSDYEDRHAYGISNLGNAGNVILHGTELLSQVSIELESVVIAGEDFDIISGEDGVWISEG